MQSFLQYRRFGRHVERQHERNRHKATGRLNGGDGAAGGDNDDAEKAQDDYSPRSPSSTASPSSSFDSGVLTAHDAHASKDFEKVETGDRDDTASHQKAPEGTPMSRPQTLRRIGTALGVSLTGIDVRDRSTREGKDAPNPKVFVVGYESPSDPLNPLNWSRLTRIGATINIAAIGWIVGFASSIDSSAIKEASKQFGVSEVAESLATGLFLVGFGVGALFAGPVSETVGRNPVYIVTLLLYMIFIMAAGLATDLGQQLPFRFLAGFFASTPLTCAGGSIADLWTPMERVWAFPVFANAAFIGPIFGPVVGGFIAESSLVSWKWTEWVTLIISGGVLLLVVLTQPETYAPVLLSWKAKKLRVLTKDERYKAEIEIRGETFIRRLGHALYRPFLLTVTEPIIMLIALYLTVIYIILFTFLEGYKFIFTETYGFSEGITGLSFIGIGIGLCLATAMVPFIYRWAKRDMARIKAQGGDKLPPEFRLWFVMFSGPGIPISLFWMGWTAKPSISYWSPLGASVLFGYGILGVFISSYQYIIDSYETYSASALASATLIRYAASGGMTVVAIPFYKNMGVHWTLTILGCISALLVPVPYAFYVYGPRIRKWSKYAVE